MLVLLYHKVIKNPGFDLWWRTFDLQIKILKSLYKIVSLDEGLGLRDKRKMPQERGRQ
jgi:hypothetical protein